MGDAAHKDSEKQTARNRVYWLCATVSTGALLLAIELGRRHPHAPRPGGILLVWAVLAAIVPGDHRRAGHDRSQASSRSRKRHRALAPLDTEVRRRSFGCLLGGQGRPAAQP